MMNTISVMIVDDHPMVLQGIKALLSSMKDIELVGLAGNAFEAIDILKKQLVDVTILDINLPDINGIELCKKIKKDYPYVHVLAMSTFKERTYISQMIQQGASGYLLKSASAEEINDAIHAAHKGKLYLSMDINPSVFEKMDKPPTEIILTRREKEILTLIAEGFTNPQIAEKLFVSSSTVDTHRKNLLLKLNANNTATLIRIAVQQKLIDV